MANISARTNQSEMILKICLQYFLISKMRTSSDIVYYFRDHALVFYVCMNFFDQTKFEISPRWYCVASSSQLISQLLKSVFKTVLVLIFTSSFFQENTTPSQINEIILAYFNKVQNKKRNPAKNTSFMSQLLHL